MKLSPFSTVFYTLRRKLFLQNAWANWKRFSIHMWLVINKKHCRNSEVRYEIAYNNSYSASRLRQYSKWRKNSTFCIYTLVKENKKATFFYGIVSVLGVVPMVDGTLWLTFATSWCQVRISKYENSKSKSIKSKHIKSVFTSKLNLRPPNTQYPFDFSSTFFSNWMKTKTNTRKAFRSTESL